MWLWVYRYTLVWLCIRSYTAVHWHMCNFHYHEAKQYNTPSMAQTWGTNGL